MKISILVFLMLNSIISFAQNEARIIQIRELYKNYTENLSNMDSYEIKLNTAGSFPFLTIYTDFADKLMIRTEDADEFGSESTEYYFLDDSIQFIFSKSERLLTHWGADTVRYEMLELRFYFENGQVIKTLKKHFSGIEGENNNSDFNAAPNNAIDYRNNMESNWGYYEGKITGLIKLYANLKQVL